MSTQYKILKIELRKKETMKDKKLQCCMVIMLCMPGSVFSMNFLRAASKEAKRLATSLAAELNQLLDPDGYPYPYQNLDDAPSNTDDEEPSRHFVVPMALTVAAEESLPCASEMQDSSTRSLTEYDQLHVWAIAMDVYLSWFEQEKKELASQSNMCTRCKRRLVKAPQVLKLIVERRNQETQIDRSLLRDQDTNSSVANQSAENLDHFAISDAFIPNLAGTFDKSNNQQQVRIPTPLATDLEKEWYLVNSDDFK